MEMLICFYNDFLFSRINFIFFVILVELITLGNGRNLLLCNKYTYSKSGPSTKTGNRWACSSHNHGCKAFIRTSKDMMILRMDLKHVHPPPNYVKTRDGKYTKM